MLFVGTIGGFAAQYLNSPMPFLIGGLATTAAATIYITQKYDRKIPFPQHVRWGCMAIIGVMIGTSFDSTLLDILPKMWLSLLAMIIFVLLIQRLGYWFFRYFGRYDRPTATFAAMPGGLLESIAMGVQAGGDVRLLSVHHFSRIILVAVIVPIAILIWSGEPVGSGAGQSFSPTGGSAADVVFILVLATTGVAIGRIARLPVYHILGPLLVSTTVHGLGWLDISTPGWLLAAAQLIIGVGLGVTFSGISVRMIMRSFGLGVVFVLCALSIGLAFAGFVSRYFQLPIEDLFICFAIGGVIEMGLVALSLGSNPVFVAIHHILRIIVTVIVVKVLLRSFKRKVHDP